MKRIITYLIVLLLTLPVMGQTTPDRKQEHKGFNKQRTIKTFKKNIKDVKHPHYQVHAKRSEHLKSTLAEKIRLDSVSVQYWNGSEWADATENVEYIYDTNENAIKETFFYLYNGWNEYEKYEFTYNTSQNVSIEIYYEWDNSQWVESEKYEYIYNTSQQLTELLYSEWISNQWIQYGKAEYTYDGNGNLILEIEFDGNMNWRKYEDTYVNNKRTQSNAYKWEGSQWVNWWKDEYFYDNNGNLDNEIDYLWYDTDWIQNEKYEYFYDTNGNTIREIRYKWNTSSGWYEFEKYEYISDLDFYIADLIVPFWYLGNYDYTLINRPIELILYNYTNGDWVEYEKQVFYGSDYDASLNVEDEILARSINLYPNPVSDVLTIDAEIPLTNVEIFSILGKKVKEMDSDFKSIQMDNLSNGIYIIRIHSEKGSTTRKLIKK